MRMASERSWIGAPGTVDAKNGVIVYANNIGFRDTPVAEIFKTHSNVPVFLGNDANCAALGEAYAGAAKIYDTAVKMITGDSSWRHYHQPPNHMPALTAIARRARTWSPSRTCRAAAAGAAAGRRILRRLALIRMTAEAMERDTEKKSLLWEMTGGIDKVSGKSAYRAADQERHQSPKRSWKTYEEYLASGVATIIMFSGGRVYRRRCRRQPARSCLKSWCFQESIRAWPRPG